MKNFILFTLINKSIVVVHQFILTGLLMAMLVGISYGQQNNFSQPQYAKAKIDISNLAHMEEKADSVVEVVIDRRTLRLAEKFLKNNDPDEMKVKELIGGIEGIWVKVYEFEKDGQVATTDYDNLRSQLQAPGWVRLAGVRSKKEKTNVEVSVMTDDNDNLLGLAIIAAEPNQFVVVNVVGTFDPAKIRDLGGKFNIPDLQLDGLAGAAVKKSTKKDKAPEENKKEETKAKN